MRLDPRASKALTDDPQIAPRATAVSLEPEPPVGPEPNPDPKIDMPVGGSGTADAAITGSIRRSADGSVEISIALRFVLPPVPAGGGTSLEPEPPVGPEPKPDPKIDMPVGGGR